MGTTTTSFLSHRQRASTGARGNTIPRRLGNEIVLMKKSLDLPTRSIEQSSGGGLQRDTIDDRRKIDEHEEIAVNKEIAELLRENKMFTISVPSPTPKTEMMFYCKFSSSFSTAERGSLGPLLSGPRGLLKSGMHD